MRSSVPPQVCSTSSRWAAIASTSAMESAAKVDLSSIKRVIGIGSGVHVSDVRGSAGHSHVLIVDRRSVFGRVDVNLPTLHCVDLVQTGHSSNAGCIADVRLKHHDFICRCVVHRHAAEGLVVIEPLTLVALSHSDPERAVVAENHAAGAAWNAVAD